MKSLESLGNNDLGLDKENADPQERAKVSKKLKDPKAKMPEEPKHAAMPTVPFALKYADLTSNFIFHF